MVKKNETAATVEDNGTATAADNEHAGFDPSLGGEDLFDLNVSDVPPSIILPEGEYRARVDKAEFKQPEQKPGKQPYKYFNIRISFPEYPTADDVFLMVPYPTGHEDEKQALAKKRELKKFLDAVGIDTTERWGIQQSLGAEFNVRLIQKYDNNQRLRNEVGAIVN